MKILIVQLARFGDLVLTRPTLRALKRTHPAAEIHILVRQTFQEALFGLEEIAAIHRIPVSGILEDIDSILSKKSTSGGQPTEGAIEKTVTELIDVIDPLLVHLQRQRFDQIVNLSFSISSSYLVHLISEGSMSAGYTRHMDGPLAIPDDPSAYFYAQVGVGRFNRLHVSDLMANICQVDLIESDWVWNIPSGQREVSETIVQKTRGIRPSDLLIHIGSSDSRKSVSAEVWAEIIRSFLREWSGRVLLIGSDSERAISGYIKMTVSNDRVVDLAGNTRFQDLYAMVNQSAGVVGADSTLIHIAALFNVKTCVCLSVGPVNFFETGPKMANSWTYRFGSTNQIDGKNIASDLCRILLGKRPQYAHAHTDATRNIRLLRKFSEELPWNLIRAIYMGGEFPRIVDKTLIKALLQIDELIVIGVEQISEMGSLKNKAIFATVLGGVDTAINTVSKLAPEIGPLVLWFETEKLRVGPLPLEGLVAKYSDIYMQLQALVQTLLLKSAHFTTEDENGTSYTQSK